MGTDQDVIPADTVVIENRLCLWIGITVMLVGLGFVLLIYFIDAENPDAVPVPVRVFSFGTFAAIPLLGLIVVLLSVNSLHIEKDRLIVCRLFQRLVFPFDSYSILLSDVDGEVCKIFLQGHDEKLRVISTKLNDEQSYLLHSVLSGKGKKYPLPDLPCVFKISKSFLNGRLYCTIFMVFLSCISLLLQFSMGVEYNNIMTLFILLLPVLSLPLFEILHHRFMPYILRLDVTEDGFLHIYIPGNTQKIEYKMEDCYIFRAHVYSGRNASTLVMQLHGGGKAYNTFFPVSDEVALWQLIKNARARRDAALAPRKRIGRSPRRGGTAAAKKNDGLVRTRLP